MLFWFLFQTFAPSNFKKVVKMRFKTMWFVIFFFGVLQFSFAQEKTVTGTVKDHLGEELPGVAVIVKGEQKGTQTGFDGTYSLKVAVGKTLVFSYIGMQSKEVKVGASNTIDVVLEEEAQGLDEVVVTGYNTRKREVSSANVTTVSGENLGKLTPSTSVDNMLQGKASGVDVTALNGKPGQTATIKIRGAISLNTKGGDKAQPLYVIDGVFVSESDLNILNPNDIETMSVLKDAASTAIYGSRGANGVIVITTKQGKKGNAKISYSGRTGFGEKIKDRFEMMNAAEKMQYEEVFNPTRYSRTPEQKAQLLGYDHNWADDILRTAQIISHTLSASGATDNGAYFFSGGWDKNTGIVRNNDGFSRITARANFNTKLSEKLKIGLNSSVSHTTSDELRDRNNIQNPFRAIYLYNPYEPVFERNDDGSFVIDSEGNYVYNAGSQPFSIIEGIMNAPSVRKTTHFVANAFADYELGKGFSFKTQYSANYRRYKGENYTMPKSQLDIIVGDPKAPGSKSDYGRDSYLYTWLNQLNYQKSFGQHNFNATVFSEFTEDYYHSYSLSNKGYNSKLLNTQDNGAKATDTETKKEESAIFSLATSVEYDYNGIYLASASIRRDGASRFGKNNRYGTFWSGSLGWNIAKEEFLKSAEWLNNLKLTASYGTTGNWYIPNYAAQGYYRSSSYNEEPSAIINTNIANPDLTWEKQESLNFGVETSMFHNRLSFTASYFSNTRKDFLFELSLPKEGGAYTKYVNAGKMATNGIELSFNADVLKTTDFKWSVGGNITFIDYKIKSLDGRDNLVVSGISVLKEGETPFTFYLPQYAGVDTNNGDALYYNHNQNTGEVKVVSDFSQATTQLLSGKSPFAKQYGGFNTSINYKGIDLSADFSFKLGNYSYNYVTQNLLSDGRNGNDNQRKDALDYWKKPGDNKLPALSAKNSQTTDRFLQDASFLRLRNVTLGYNIPKDFIKGANVRVFVQAQNLYTWTKFEGDPEISIGSGENQLGTNQNFIPGLYYQYSYPTLQTYTMGVDITF